MGSDFNPTNKSTSNKLASFTEPHPNSTFVDTSGRFRISNINLDFSSQLLETQRNLVWNTQLVTGGIATYNVNESTLTLTVGTGSTDKAIRQTKKHFTYFAGQSRQVWMTFSSASMVSNVVKRIGYFDNNDGIFLESSDDIYFVIRSSITGTPVETKIRQIKWNLDPMNGTGQSKINLDFSKVQILTLDVQWLGAGQVRCGFNVNGANYHAHRFEHTNHIATTYMKTATLPVRYEIANTATSAGSSLKQICSAVATEGNDIEGGVLTSMTTGFSGSTSTTAERTVLSARLKSTNLKSFAKVIESSLINLGNGTVQYRIILNPTVTGGSFVWSSAGNDSILQKSTSQLTYVAGSGHVISTGFVDSSNQIKSTVFGNFDTLTGLTSDTTGSADIMSMTVSSSATTNVVAASLSFREFI